MQYMGESAEPGQKQNPHGKRSQAVREDCHEAERNTLGLAYLYERPLLPRESPPSLFWPDVRRLRLVR